MYISAINKFSLIEYPDEVSCVIFTPGCNFRCWYCHNSEFVLPEKLKNVYNNLIPHQALFSFLEKRKGLLTAVSICGWEPTLQSNLIEFCSKLKGLWYLVKLDTNGQNPELIKKLISKNLVDYIAMDIKNEVWKFNKIIWKRIDEAPYLESISILLQSSINYEFRTTVIKWIHSQDNIENISRYIKWAKAYYIQNYRPWKTLEPNFIWSSYSSLELEKLQKIAQNNIQKVRIRN